MSSHMCQCSERDHMVTLLPTTLLDLTGEYGAKLVHINAHTCMHIHTHAHTHRDRQCAHCPHTHTSLKAAQPSCGAAMRWRTWKPAKVTTLVQGQRAKRRSRLAERSTEPTPQYTLENHSSKKDSGTLGFWFENPMNTLMKKQKRNLDSLVVSVSAFQKGNGVNVH